MLLELNIVPLGKGESLSEDVAKVLKLIDESGLPYRVGPMGTVIEGDWDELMELVKRCHQKMLEVAPRVITTIKIDDRPSKPLDRIEQKIASVEKRLGRRLKR